MGRYDNLRRIQRLDPERDHQEIVCITGMEEPVLDAFGFPHPPRWLRGLAAGTLRLRGRVLQLFPPRRNPRIYTAARHRTCPRGYRIADLGPPDFIAPRAPVAGAAEEQGG